MTEVKTLIKYGCKLRNVKLDYIHDFAIELPFEKDIFATFAKTNDNEWLIFVPSSDPKEPLIQAMIYADNHADLQYVRSEGNNQLPVKGGGNYLLEIWDFIAEITEITFTNVVDMSHLSLEKYRKKESINNEEEYKQVSLKLLSMVTNGMANMNDNTKINKYETWYEKNGYRILNGEIDNYMEREAFFTGKAEIFLMPLKEEIKIWYRKLIEGCKMYYYLPELIKLYIDVYYKKEEKVIEYMHDIWNRDKVKYVLLEKIILKAPGTINKIMQKIHNEEQEYTKYY